MRCAALLTSFLLAVLGCDSNPTPHPSRSADVAVVGETTGGGAGDETASPGFDNEQDPDEYADGLAPTAGVDAPDAADAPDGDVADDNETTITGDVSADAGGD